MNIEFDGEVVVSLSERNLRDLAAQVAGDHTNPWLKGVEGVTAQLVRSCYAGSDSGVPEYVTLRVIVQPDDVHYGERVPGPGTYDGR